MDAAPGKDLVDRMTVDDVYELAQQIGKEFETIIDEFGSQQIVARLMPRVIEALEHLEAYSMVRQDYNEQIEALQLRVNQLEHEKQEDHERRAKFELDLEQIEQTLRNEIDHQKAMIAELKTENGRLRRQLHDKESSLSHSLPGKVIECHIGSNPIHLSNMMILLFATDIQSPPVTEEARQVTRLQELVDKKDALIKQMKQEISQLNNELFKVRSRISM